MKANGFRTIIIRGVLLIILSLYFLVVFAQKPSAATAFPVNNKINTEHISPITDKKVALSNVQHDTNALAQIISLHKQKQNSARRDSSLAFSMHRLTYIDIDNMKSLLLLELQEREVNTF